MTRATICLAAALAAAGCSTIASGRTSIPYGEFDGANNRRADLDMYDVVIVGIDGEMYFDGRKKERLKPGPHLLQVASTKEGRRGELTYQSLPLTVKPCTRYTFAAKHDPSLTNGDWELVLVSVSPVPSCQGGTPEDSAQSQPAKPPQP